MIKKYDGKMGFREFFIIIFLSISLMITDTTPTLLIKNGMNAAWMIPIISGLITLLPISCLLSLLKLYGDKNLIDIIFHLTGKYLGYIIVILLLLITFEYSVISTREYTDILSTMFYLNTPMYFLLLILVASSSYIASKGISIIGSLAWFLCPFVMGSLLILIPVAWKEANFNYLFPLGGPGIAVLLEKGVINATILDILLISSVFFTKIRSYREYKSAILWGLGASSLLVSFFMIIYIGVFGYPTLTSIIYPHQQLTRLVHLGRYATNTEAVYLWFWVIASTIRFGVFYYANAAIIASIMNIKKSKPLSLIIGIMIFIIAMIPENYTKYILVFRSAAISYLWTYIIGLPLLLWIIAKVRGEFKNEKA
ncbi:GerAB/ArcD/ProY family transporter [Proteiniborus sp. MB09-C3]|uniref:GerAB/ArcD/ProY family transporter n=1 Tax=Proteiniborus sp. MB09-C3 TaxID=3050072 RepID=UPI0025561F05|nr:GerAB/ArcD/ProY family transporter [Proteiniborus sp. MB09-C3]WIV12993.1 GerAB/ArcD/ProY family transporter [Proteiniborus sp. MB09-C3]